MPLIKIDYDEKILDAKTMDDLVQELLKESMRIYNYGEDKVSIFSASYGDHAFSTAAAEIEVRAKFAEYQNTDIAPNDLRQKHMEMYKSFLDSKIKQYKLPKGIVFTITFEDWEVAWLSAES